MAVLLVVTVGGCNKDYSIPGNPTAPTPVDPSPTPTPTPTPTPPQTVEVSYNQDIKPIMDADCVRCHADFATYQGLRPFATPSSNSAPLVMVTQSGGTMFSQLSGNRTAKADLIRRWVVEFNAAENR